MVTVAKNFEDNQIDLIICSPLRRTVQTANIMNAYHHVKIIKDPLLIEIDQGTFTGIKYSMLTEAEQEAKRLRLPGYGLETYIGVYHRVKKFVEKLKTDYSSKTVLVVTHESSCPSLLKCCSKTM